MIQIWLALLVQFACAGATDSTVEVVYILNKDQYRFFAERREPTQKGLTTRAMAASFIDRHLIQKSAITTQEYEVFLKQTQDFIAERKRGGHPPSLGETCRAPYVINIRIGNQTNSFSGCRNLEDTERGLSHLVKQGEFLLFSKR